MQFSTSMAKRRGADSSLRLLFILIVTVGLLGAGPVWAQTDIVTFNNIELDGDSDKDVVPPNIPGIADWDDVYADCLADPANCTPTTTGALRQAHVDDSGTDFTVFDGGLKDIHPIKDWSCNSQPVQNKSDILHAYGATYQETYALPGEDPIDHIVFYGGADRLDNNGSANFGIWLFQTPVGCDSSVNGGASTPFTGQHVDGDLLLVAEFDRGGSVTNLNVYKWTDPTPLLPESGDECVGNGIDCSPANEGQTFATGVNCNVSGPGDQVCGVTNDTVDIDTAWRAAIPTNGFYEAGSNLSDLLDHEQLGCFATAMIETRSTTELTAQLKDFAFLDLSTCGTLEVRKTAEGDQEQFFGFSVDPSAESADVPDVFNLQGGGSKFFGSVEADTYVISEASPEGWTLTDISCTGGTPGAPVYDNGGVDGGSISVDIDFNDDVVCTFTNNEPATITVVKDTIGGDDTFDFSWSSTGNGVNPFQLTTVAGTDSVTYEITTGLGDTDFEVSETLHSGWQFVSVQCLDEQGLPRGTEGSSGDTYSISGMTINPGDDITCTYENQAIGTIVINKDAVGGDGAFSFTSSPALGDVLGTDFNIITSGGHGDTGPILNLAAGSYTVQEANPQVAPGGWDFTGLVCLDPGDNGSSVDLGTRRAILDVDPGETISCTFTNTKRGQINVVKTTAGGDDTFAFTSSTLGDFNITTSGGTGNLDAQFSNLLPGDYDVAETALAGWDLDSATCDDGSDPSAIDLAPGEVVTCTFHNIKRGSIEIVKSITAWTGLDPQPAGKTFTFDAGGAMRFDGIGGAVVQSVLTPVDEATDGTTGPVEVIPGLFYTVTEADPSADGWALLSASCDDGSDPTVGIDVQPGEAVVCTFTNQPLGSAVVQKTTVGGEAEFEFTWGNDVDTSVPEGELAVFTIDTTGDGGTDTMEFSNKLLVDEDYDLAESLLPAFVGPYSQGWFLTDVGCTDVTGDTQVPGANGANATIVADTGETVSCVFTNTLEGALIIRKETVPDGLEVGFDFSGSVNDTLMDHSAFGDEAFVLGLPSGGPYTAMESVPDGWALTDISCVAEDGVLNSTVTIGDAGLFDVGDEGVSVDLAAGEIVVCTFENTLQGGITVVKNVIGADTGFNFSAPEYDADGFMLSNGQSNHSGPLMAGTYNVTETIAQGYALTNISCDAEDGQLDSSVTEGANGVQIGLVPGEEVVCTFTNTQLGSITVEKQTSPDGSSQTFAFSGDVGGTLADGGTATLSLLPGIYTTTEAVPANWDLTSIVCSDGNSTGDIGSATATYRLEPGENVTCTFTNTIQRGNIVVVKQTDPDGSLASFDFTTNYGGGFSLTDDQSNDSGALLPTSEAGTYSVAETGMPTGWDLTTAVCDDGSDPSAIDLAPDETVTCTFTNTIQRGNIVVVKQTLPEGSPVSFGFTTSYGAPFSLTDDTQNDSGDLLPSSESGTYEVLEDGVTGWNLTDVSCTGDVSGAEDPSEINLDPGETVTCVFENTQDGRVEIALELIPGLGDVFNFVGATATTLGHQQFFGVGVNPGNYQTRTPRSAIDLGGWFIQSFTCDDGDSVIDFADPDNVIANYNVAPGETVRCTLVLIQLTDVPVPANNAWALLLLIMMTLAVAWHFVSAVSRNR